MIYFFDVFCHARFCGSFLLVVVIHPFTPCAITYWFNLYCFSWSFLAHVAVTFGALCTFAVLNVYFFLLSSFFYCRQGSFFGCASYLLVLYICERRHSPLEYFVYVDFTSVSPFCLGGCSSLLSLILSAEYLFPTFGSISQQDD